MKWLLAIALSSFPMVAMAQDDPVVRDIMSRGWPDSRYTVHYHVTQKNLLSDDQIEKKVGELLARVTFTSPDTTEMSKVKDQIRAANHFRERSYDCFYVNDPSSFYYEGKLLSQDGKAPAAPVWSVYGKVPRGDVFVSSPSPGQDGTAAGRSIRLGFKSTVEGVDFSPIFGIQLDRLNPLPDPSVADDLRNEKDVEGYAKAMAPYPRKGPGGSFEWDAGYMKTTDFNGQKVIDTYVAGEFQKPFAVMRFSDYQDMGGMPVATKVVTDFYLIPALTGVQDSVKEEEVTMTLDSLETSPDANVGDLLKGLVSPDTHVFRSHPDGTVETALYSEHPELVDLFLSP